MRCRGWRWRWDADRAAVAVGGTGEIRTRGSPAAVLRYWDKPAVTAAKWRDGWLRTGDPGRAEADGTIAFVSRDNDVINSAGYRLGPAEIETCLMAHPAVAMCAVVGLPDPELGEAVTAFGVAPEAGEGLAEALIARVRARLSPHMAPRAIRFVEALPTTATGTIQRRSLRGG